MIQVLTMEDEVCIVYEYMDLTLGDYIERFEEGLPSANTRVSHRCEPSFPWKKVS
jgi:hypothetical protein